MITLTVNVGSSPAPASGIPPTLPTSAPNWPAFLADLFALIWAYKTGNVGAIVEIIRRMIGNLGLQARDVL